MRARTHTQDIAAMVLQDLATLRAALQSCPECTGSADEALTGVETFTAIALRVLAKTNPSKVASEARTVEICLRMPPHQGGGS